MTVFLRNPDSKNTNAISKPGSRSKPCHSKALQAGHHISHESKRARCNSEVLTNLKTQSATVSLGIKQAEKHAGDCSDRRDACDACDVSCIHILGLGCRLYNLGLAGEVVESGVLAAM